MWIRKRPPRRFAPPLLFQEGSLSSLNTPTENYDSIWRRMSSGLRFRIPSWQANPSGRQQAVMKRRQNRCPGETVAVYRAAARSELRKRYGQRAADQTGMIRVSRIRHKTSGRVLTTGANGFQNRNFTHPPVTRTGNTRGQHNKPPNIAKPATKRTARLTRSTTP